MQHRDAPSFRSPEKPNPKRGRMGDDYQLPSEAGGYDAEAESPKGHVFQVPRGRPLRWRRNLLGAPGITTSRESMGLDVRPEDSQSSTGRPQDETAETQHTATEGGPRDQAMQRQHANVDHCRSYAMANHNCEGFQSRMERDECRRLGSRDSSSE